MASIIIRSNDKNDREIPLNQNITTLGRNSENDIIIDNPGISGSHAKILYNDGFQIMDLKSSNGTFVNGKRLMAPVTLKQGDTIAISKTTLEFRGQADDKPSVFIEDQQQQQNMSHTMVVDPSQLNAMLHDHRINDAEKKGQLMARLNYLDGKKKQQSFLINKPKVRIGKDLRNDIQIKGWFAPKIAASIEYQQNSYALHPQGGKIKLNDEVIKSPQTLKNGDRIQVRSLEIIFNLSTLMGY